MSMLTVLPVLGTRQEGSSVLSPWSQQDVVSRSPYLDPTTSKDLWLSRASDRTIDEVRVSLPILNLGLPKSATTSIFDFFTCAGVRTSHYRCGDAEAGKVPPAPTPFANASVVAATCKEDDKCRCKIFGTELGTTTHHRWRAIC